MHNSILDKNYFAIKSNISLLSPSLILFYYLTFSGFRCNQKSPTWVGLLLSLVYTLSISTAVHVIAVLLCAFTSIMLPLGSQFVSTYPDALTYREWKLLQCALLWLRVHNLHISIILSSYPKNLIWFFCSAIYLLIYGIWWSIINIITGLHNIYLTLCLLQVFLDHIQLVPNILPSKDAFIIFLWFSDGKADKIINERNPTSYFSSLSSYVSFVLYIFFHL